MIPCRERRDAAAHPLLARYELGEEVGRGGEGAVYRARERATGRVVAIKKLRMECRRVLSGTTGLDAPRLARSLTHRNIAAVHDVLVHGPFAFVVMDFAAGADLRCHARRSSLLPLGITIALMTCVAQALAHAHERGRVHGDVKPANIVFEAASVSVKLADFGLHEMGFAPGTTAYMSPQRLCGRPPNAADDRFAFGVTLYELACGRRPFESSTLPQLVRAIAQDRHPDVREHDGSLPAALSSLLDRLLDKRSELRLSSTRALVQAMRRIAPAGESAA